MGYCLSASSGLVILKILPMIWLPVTDKFMIKPQKFCLENFLKLQGNNCTCSVGISNKVLYKQSNNRVINFVHGIWCWYLLGCKFFNLWPGNLWNYD